MASAGPHTSAAENLLQPKLTIIRVKRKRGDDAPDDLLIEGLSNGKRRTHASLASAFGGMGLASDAQAEEEESLRPRRRFRKATTVSAAQLSNMELSQLHSLLHAQNLPSTSNKSSLKRPADEVPSKQQEQQQQPPQQNAKYRHIRRRRGLSNFERTEATIDPLRGIAGKIIDIVRQPSSDDEEERLQQQREQHAAAQYDEGTLMCNYMPMVREYLHENKQQTTASRSAADFISEQGNNIDNGVEDMDSDYVYDLYIAEERCPAGTHGDDEDEDQTAAWWQLHASGAAPVVRIVDDDTWLVAVGSDVEDSDVDTEDSNAEGYYANDYPDEDEWNSSDEDEDDSWGHRGNDDDDSW